MNGGRRESGRRDRGPKREGSAPGGRKQYFRRRKVCKFCDEKIDVIDYKDVKLVGQFVSEREQILPRCHTVIFSTQQRFITEVIRRDRNIELLPLPAEH